MTLAIAIRPPREADIPALANLAGQLGYPTNTAEMHDRLVAVADNDHARVLVATDAADRTIGWVHVELRRTLAEPLTARIMGLVVDERARGGGVGRDLLHAAEAWAVERVAGT
jgi:GNAT superfamily N-acetyltransferase